MVFYNLFSVTVFAVCLSRIPKTKSLERLYFIACLEVVIHQILADYFLGTAAGFHFFFLLMGIIPYMIFEKKANISLTVSSVLTIIFMIYENIFIASKYEIDDAVINVIRVLNITITLFIIVIMLLIFTKIVENVENHLTRQKKSLEQEINLAAVIQQNFFAQDISILKGWDIAYFSHPMVGVSGDVYDFYKKDGVLHGLGIFDVSGHGISSGLVTMLVKNIIFHEFYNGFNRELWEVMNRINDRVIREKGDIENYLTGILLRINNNRIEMVSASHPEPIMYKKSEKRTYFIPQIKDAVGAIGIQDFPAFYYSQYFDFDKGDTLVLYSDGITDIQNADGEMFGKERLLNIVDKTNNLSANMQIEEISKAVDEFRGTEPQNDDITVIVIKK